MTWKSLRAKKPIGGEELYDILLNNDTAVRDCTFVRKGIVFTQIDSKEQFTFKDINCWKHKTDQPILDKKPAKLSAYDCWIKKTNENLTNEEYKQLLKDNGIIVPFDKCIDATFPDMPKHPVSGSEHEAEAKISDLVKSADACSENEAGAIEIKIHRKTLPTDGQQIIWQTHEDFTNDEWKVGTFCEGDDFFIVTTSYWDASWDVYRWLPASTSNDR